MRDLTSKIFCFFAVLLLIASANAAKLEKLPFMSDVHLGVVSGPGLGLNIGLGAWFNAHKFKVGFDVDQLMTDVDYSTTISATRYGGVIGYDFGDFNINWHVGALSFTPGRNISYKDMAGKPQLVNENVNYKGNYMAVSADFITGEFTLSPKYIVNTINNKGSLAEFDLNLGKAF